MSEVVAKWGSLGIAFDGASNIAADPESLIIDSLEHFPEDRKLVSLVFAWLKSYSSLIHVERLKSMTKLIPAESARWLGGLASFCTEFDRRWASLQKKCLSDKKPKRQDLGEFDALQIERLGEDPYFAQAGLKIPTISWEDKERKLFTREHIINNHFWFRLRVLFGANWRADVAWELVRDSEQTPYQVAKRLGCNMETAYRNWKALNEADALSLFAK